jgi:hypothetical protein
LHLWNTHSCVAGESEFRLRLDPEKGYPDEKRSEIPSCRFRAAALSAGREGRQGENGLWIAPSYSLTEHHGDRDYSIRGPGIAAGIDRWFTDFFYLGPAPAVDFPRYDGNDARTAGARPACA